MVRPQFLRVLGASLSCVALVAVGTASARADEGRVTAASRTCGGNSSVHPGSFRTASEAASTAFSEYDDHILDVAGAPDICMANAMTNDNRTFTMGVHIHDRSGFAPLDAYSILLDTDSNPATGAPADAGVPAGTEYVIDLADGASALRAWTGSAFEAVAPQPEIATVWSEDYGPVLQIARAALGDPQRLSFVLRTTYGSDIDLAPDVGSWSYAVTPLRLTVETFGMTPARAGKPFGVALEVTRSDFDIALDEGTIACAATAAGKKLAGRGRFLADLATCNWRLPRTARGKQVRGAISVTFQDVTVKRSFAVRVK